jgi:hypothetical protein
MGDPVTMAVVGGTIGAATNRKDPLKGALMGAAGGYAGGAMFPTAGAGAAGSANAMIPGVQGGMGTLAGETTALTGTSGGMFGGMSNMFNNASIPSSISGLGKDISAANKWMNQNPVTSQIGFKLAQDMLQAEPVQMPGGMPVNRGQIQPMDYMSLLNPQQQTVIRPATPSLI